jgi:hypothetical protein
MMRVDPLNDFTWLLGLDMAEHARELRQTWHCNCQWVMANGGSAPGTAPIVNFASPHFEKNPTLGGRDYLRDYVPHAHAAGLRVLAYVNLHWFSYVFADAHPGWEQLLADGRAYGRVNPLYGNGTTLCVNSAHGLIYSRRPRGLPDGHLDGPVVFPGACHVPPSRAFRERIGAEPRRVTRRSLPSVSRTGVVHGALRRRGAVAVQSVNPEGIVHERGRVDHHRGGASSRRLEAHQHLTGAEERALRRPGRTP